MLHAAQLQPFTIILVFLRVLHRLLLMLGSVHHVTLCVKLVTQHQIIVHHVIQHQFILIYSIIRVLVNVQIFTIKIFCLGHANNVYFLVLGVRIAVRFHLVILVTLALHSLAINVTPVYQQAITTTMVSHIHAAVTVLRA